MADNLPRLIVLAGGASSRFWPLKEKTFLKFCGQPLLERQLQTYIDIGFRQVVVIGHPNIKSRLESIRQKLGEQVECRILIQAEAKGMGDALLTLRPLLEEVSSPVPVYICQVHDICDRSLHEHMLQAYFRSPDTTWLASYRVSDHFPGGYLVADNDSTITSIIEKPAIGSEPSQLVNIVAHIHPDLKCLLDQIEVEYGAESSSDDHYERAMNDLMKKYPFKAVPYAGPWHAIKYPWHVLDVMQYYLSQLDHHIADDATIAEHVQLDGPVHICSGAKILDGASIVGPAYIGPNTLIGQYSHVRHAMIEESCVIGIGSEVNRSYIGCNTMMHSAKALDSVLAENVGDGEPIDLAAGVITANLRADGLHIKSTVKGERLNTGRTKFGAVIGSGAFIGIGAMLMPGVKVGEKSIVGPATLVHKDVADNTLFFSKQHYVTKPLHTDAESDS